MDKPKAESVNKKGEKITNYVIGIVFDLDASSLKEYDEERDLERLKSLKTTAEPQKLIQIFKTFFGKVEGDKASKGELIEVIDKDFLELKDTKFYGAIKDIFKLRNDFLNKALNKDKSDIDHRVYCGTDSVLLRLLPTE